MDIIDNDGLFDYDKMSTNEKIQFHKYYFDKQKDKILEKLSVNIGENQSYWNYYKNKLYYNMCYYDEVIMNKIINVMIYIGPIPKIENYNYNNTNALDYYIKNTRSKQLETEWYWDYEWCSDGYKKAIHKTRQVWE